MIPFTLSNIAPLLNAKLVGEDRTILNVFTDSRVQNTIKNGMFVALNGKNFDAHNFAEQAISSGAIALLISRKLPLDIPQLIVNDTYFALVQLAAWVRQQTQARIVALTGSSGKTSVKEMTAAILRQCGRVLATNGNFNNDIGVPLTLLQLTPAHDFAVIELGTNHPGEIGRMSNLVHPEVALINNISAAHLSGLGSLSGIAQAKGEIFSGLLNNGRGIFNAKSHDWPLWQNMLINKQVWCFDLHPAENVDFFAKNIISNHQEICFVLHSPSGSCQIELPLIGVHNVANALAASALSMAVGAKLPALAAGLAKIKSLPGRLFPISLGIGRLLLDDSYNANVSSMTAATQVLANMPGYRVMVVGDMLELGNEAAKYHQQIGKTIALANIDKVLSIGNLSCIISETSGHGEHFQDKKSLIARLMQLLSEQKIITILVKGSHSTAMEQVVYTLQDQASC